MTDSEINHYGQRHKKSMKKETLIELLQDYVASSINSSPIYDFINVDCPNDEVLLILGDLQDDWDNAECDESGPTKEQDKKLNNLLSHYAERLLAIA